MSSLIYKDRVYGGVSTITNSDRVVADNGSGTLVTSQQMFSNILGDIATVEAEPFASKAYDVGEYLIYGGYFYRVAAAINIGDGLIYGSNIIRTDIATEMNELNLKSIQNITRSGTTFTVTRNDGTTFTFDQQDNDHYAWTDITDKPTTFAPETHSHAWG